MLRKNNYNGSRRKTNRIVLYAALGLMTALILTYLLFSFYYQTHFYTKTVINGVSASNLTVNQVEDAINAQVKTYVLTLKERYDRTEQLGGDEINLHAVFDGSLTDLLGNQNSFTWPVSAFIPRDLEVKTMLEYDEDTLKQKVMEFGCFDQANVVKPVDAHVSEYGDNGYTIIPEEDGAQVKEDILLKVVEEAIMSLQQTVSLEKAKCYEKAKIDSTYPKLVEAVKNMNKMAGSKITYEFGEVTEIIDGNRISKWISLDENYNVSLDTEGVKEFVDYIGKNYNSFGRVRTFQTSYDKVIKLKGGDYGWWLNRGKELEELTQLIKDGEQLIREPVYFQTAQQYGKDDIGDTYVEVNLTAQHLFFYKDGKLILESDFVSGNVSRRNGTPTGTYPVQYKENDATLTGEDYSTPVKYWMPFNGNIGFHDASWRTEFGEDIYLTNGSHGCINMPPAKAKKMFENINRGVAVVVYRLRDTESFNKDKDQEQAQDQKKEQKVE